MNVFQILMGSSDASIFSFDSSDTLYLPQLLGWSLIHFLWQGCLLAIVVWTVMKILQNAPATIRYVVLCGFMLVLTACPFATMAYLSNYTSPVKPGKSIAKTTSLTAGQTETQIPENKTKSEYFFGKTPSEIPVDSSNFDTANIDSKPAGIHSASTGIDNPISPDALAENSRTSVTPIGQAEWFWSGGLKAVNAMTPTLVIFWLIGVFLLSTRLLYQWISTNRLKSKGTEAVDPKTSRLVRQLQNQFSLHKEIVVKISSLVDAPTLLGWIRPIILLPASAITGLTSEQLRAVIAHELAHIRRADYVVNLLQAVVETILFYHPAVWWLSNQIRVERENCCDDIAAKTCQSPKQYAQALLTLEQTRTSMGSRPELGIRADGASLVNRIARLLGKTNRQKGNRSWLAGAFSLSLVLMFSLTVFAGSKSTAVDAAPHNFGRANLIEKDIPLQENEKKQDDTDKPKKLTITVYDESGSPLADAKIFKSHVWRAKDARTPTVDNSDFKTNKKGNVSIELHPDEQDETLRLWASKEGYAGLFFSWEEEDIKGDNPIPATYTFKLVKGQTIGGFIKNDRDEPIVGAKVEVSCDANPTVTAGPKFNTYLSGGEDAIQTDKNGYWELSNVPPVKSPNIKINVSHPDYIDDERQNPYQAEQGIADKDLLSRTAVVRMPAGISLVGTITDADGKPVTRGLVVWGDNPYWQDGSQEASVDSDGNYVIPPQKPGKIRLTVVVPNWKPVTKIVDVGSMSNQFDFQLEKGVALIMKFVDEKGEVVKPVGVGINKWQGVESLYNHVHPNVKPTQIPVWTDEGGVYRWNWAPSDELVVTISGFNFAPIRELKITPDGELHQISLRRIPSVSGSVVDKETREVIKNAKVIPVRNLGGNRLVIRRENLVIAKDGKFNIKVGNLDTNFNLLVEADGYRGFLTSTIEYGKSAEQKVELTKADPVAGRIVDSDGAPVANMQVAIASKNQPLSLRSLHFDSFSGHRTTTTDGDGRFQFSAPHEEYQIIAFGNEGSAKFVCKKIVDQPNEIRLNAYASISGKLFLDGKPAKGINISLADLDSDLTQSNFQLDTRVDKDGNFQFPKLPSGSYKLSTNLWRDKSLKSDDSIPVRLAPGEKRSLDMTPMGIPVSGKLIGQQSRLGMGPMSGRHVIELDAANFSQREGNLISNWTAYFTTTFEGIKELQSYRIHKLNIAKDGSFSITLPAGKYAIQTNQWEVSAFEVTENDVNSGGLDLGSFDAGSFKPFKIGDTFPTIEFSVGDTEKKIGDYSDKSTMICLVAGKSRLTKVLIDRCVDKIKKDNLDVNFLILNIGDDVDFVEELIKENKINAQVGVLCKWTDVETLKKLGIGFAPSALIIDSRLKITSDR